MKLKEQIVQNAVTNRIAAALFFILAFILYGNTLGHKYCLDDAIVISRNEFTKKGFDGIGDIFRTESFTGFFGQQKELVSGARYRPLSIVTFAIEQQFFHGNTFISHLINILLYALTAFVIYLILKKILKKSYSSFISISFITALLFLFHPIHTEVVANIKGRDEILALLLSLVACYLIIRYTENKNILLLFSGGLLWFMALLSKENAIVFWVLLPMMLYIAGIRNRKSYLYPLAVFTLAAIVFLLLRHSVIGGASGVSDELMNNSFLHVSPEKKYATIFYTLWKYIILLIYPATLTFDYYPYHVSILDWSSALPVAGLLVYVVLVGVMLVNLKKNFLITLALSLYLAPLLPVSNLLFPIGTFMSERFVYFSSCGFCLLVAYGLSVPIAKDRLRKNAALVLLGLILALFFIKTISRNQVWYNDYTLFTSDVKTSSGSAKSNCSAGGVLLESSDTIANLDHRRHVLNQSVSYLKKAIAIHPKYFDAWLLLGNAYFKQENCTDSALWCYTIILHYNSGHELAYNNAMALVNREKNEDIKIAILEKLKLYKPNDYQLNYLLGTIYGKTKNDLDKAIVYLNKAASVNPQGKDAYIDLGVAYGLKRDFAKSAEALAKALEIDPSDAGAYINLGITYQSLGNISGATECFKKANELKKR